MANLPVLDPSYYIGMHEPVAKDCLVYWTSPEDQERPFSSRNPRELCCDVQLFDLIHEKLDKVTANWKLKEQITPTGPLGHNIFMDRAGVKLANIDRVYNVTGSMVHVSRLRDFQPFSYLALCDGPGAWVQYIQFRRPNAIGTGITIHGDESTEWHLNQKESDPDIFEIFEGDGTGDLIKNRLDLIKRVREKTLKTNSGTRVGKSASAVAIDENVSGAVSQMPIGLAATLPETEAAGVDLVVADGWEEVSEKKVYETPFGKIEGKDVYRWAELVNYSLILSELAVAVLSLRPGGNLVCKVLHTGSEAMVQLLYLVSQCFTTFTLMKPISSRGGNPERYVICLDKKPMRWSELRLRELIEKNSFQLTEVAEDFRSWLRQLNDLHLRYQLYFVEKLVKQEVDRITLDLERIHLYWRLPGTWGQNYHETLDKLPLTIKKKPKTLSDFIKPCRNDNYQYLSLNWLEAREIGVVLISEWVRGRFPEKRFSISEEQLKVMMQNLINYRPIFANSKFTLPNIDLSENYLVLGTEPVMLVNKKEYYEEMNLLPEFFMDLQRMKVRNQGQQFSPLEQYGANPLKFVEACFQKYGKLDAYLLRETVYQISWEATEFKPSVMAAMIDYFGAKSVYDFSAGRGARMIGCIARKVKYLGVDPDESLQEGYRQILEKFVPPEERTNYQVILAKAQDLSSSIIPAESFDLVFTSPPYFKREHYSDDPSQSDVEFPVLSDWLDKFLLPAIVIAIAALKIGGHLAININDPARGIKDREAFTLKMVERLYQRKDLAYLGVMAYSEGSKSAQPIWVWRKLG